MKLYYSPGACSLSCRISLHEAGFAALFEQVDLKSKLTEHGFDYRAINPKGYVPMLVLDDGEAITEVDAVLDWIAEAAPALGSGGPLGRTRLIEMLSYLSTELHAAFKPFWHAATDAEKAKAGQAVVRRLAFLESRMSTQHLFGPGFTVADAYLFVMLRWARNFELPLSALFTDYFERIQDRASVRRALLEEGLIDAPAVAQIVRPEVSA